MKHLKTILPSLFAAVIAVAILFPFHPLAAVAAGMLHLVLAGGLRVLSGVIIGLWVILAMSMRLTVAAAVTLLFPSAALPFVFALAVAIAAEAGIEYFLAVRKVAHA